MNNTANHPRVKTLALTLYNRFVGRIIISFRRRFSPPVASTVIVTLCTVLFGFSALDKYINRDTFMVQMGKSPLLTGYEPYLKWGVPGVELAIAALMVWPTSRKAGLYAFYTLMALFTFYIIALLSIDSSIPCGCNALTQKMSLEWHVAMNAAFCGLTVGGIYAEQRIQQTRKEVKRNRKGGT